MMAKQISQETFDSVVLENIEEFEMCPEEAVLEAITQFEAQGVNLNTIIKEYRPKSENGTIAKHEVELAVDGLNDWLKNPDSSKPNLQLVDACRTLCESCDRSLSERCLASRSGAYPALLSAIEHTQGNPDLLSLVLKALVSLMDTQPDLLDERGTDMLFALLDDPSKAVNTSQVLCIIHKCCLLHEGNRQNLVGRGLIPKVASLLSIRRTERDVVKPACSILGALTLDDDIRVPFGKGHEHAKIIVTEADAMNILLDLSTVYIEDVDILSEIFSTISHLAVRDEFCRQVLELGGIKKVLIALPASSKHQGLVRSLLLVLKSLAGSDPVKVEFIKDGGAGLVLEVMNENITRSGICDIGCATIAALALRFPAHSQPFMDSGAPELLTRVMQIHTKVSSVQKSACMAIRNLVARNPENCSAFLEVGVESLLNQMLSLHPSCSDEVKGALRDLGCRVELRELWKGTGKQLERDD